MAETSSQRSALRDFLASLSTISGDLSTITAPPFLLGTSSTTTLPLFWAEHPSLFTAAATQPTPETRLLAVVKWFLLSLLRQQHAGRAPEQGVKKPLNAFLGELFLASFPGETGGGGGACTLVAEQVSHHPPVTACSLRCDGAGVRADGFAAQRIGFSGAAVSVEQHGHAVLTLTAHGETYLVPLPRVRIAGLLSGAAYPELHGTYVLPASSGWRAELAFSGTRALGLAGARHGVQGKVYAPGPGAEAMYTIAGRWDGEMVVTSSAGEKVDTYSAADLQHVEPCLPERARQSPWESRRAWHGVASALDRGDMAGAAREKGRIEEAQREKRRTDGEDWTPLFFKKVQRDERWEGLKGMLTDEQRRGSEEYGFWVVEEANRWAERPFREGTPWEA